MTKYWKNIGNEAGGPDMYQQADTDNEDHSRPVTFRLAKEDLSELGWLAVVDNTNLAEQIRGACSGFIAKRKADPEYHAKLDAARLQLGISDEAQD